MTELSKEQKDFLKQHNIPTSMVFDATGMRRKDWVQQISDLGLRFAYGTTPCRNGKHTLKTKAGCIQCHPEYIEFINRYYKNGYVYLACSPQQKLIKVGVAIKVKGREQSLNRLGYAGATDWEVLHSVKVDGAGQIEFAIHSELAQHNVAETYIRDGRQVVCREVFRCDMRAAFRSFEKQTGTKCENFQEITRRFSEDWNEETYEEDYEEGDEDDKKPQWFSEDWNDDQDNEKTQWFREDWNEGEDDEVDDEDQNEEARPLPGDEYGQDERERRFRIALEVSDENKSKSGNITYVLYAVSVSAINSGIRVGFTTLDKSDLLSCFQEFYPGYKIIVWEYLECPRHRKNEDIVQSNTEHFKSLPHGFFEMEPFAYSLSLCKKIQAEINELFSDEEIQKSAVYALRTAAYAIAVEASDILEKPTITRKIDKKIRSYLVERSKGNCEACDAPAPFTAKNGEPYLEFHHMIPVSEGGGDNPLNVAAVCPNCHRRTEKSVDGEDYNKSLIQQVAEIEKSMGEY
jgi:hypothetical protein